MTELAVHVIHQAVRDLDINTNKPEEAQAVYEARLFWLKDDGGWKNSRDHWLKLAGFDPEKATTAIRRKLTAEGVTLDEQVRVTPVRREFVYSVGERKLLQSMPTGEMFEAEGDLLRMLQASHKCRQSLIEKGVLQSFGDAMFFVPAHVEPLAKRVRAEPTGSERFEQAAAL